MFLFRLIDTPDGNQVIDFTLPTSYDILTPEQMLEYIEIDEQLEFMKRIAKKEMKHKERLLSLLWRITSLFGIIRR